MNSLIALLAHHGYAVVFWVVFAEAIGLPMPAALALVGAGAAVASGALRLPEATAAPASHCRDVAGRCGPVRARPQDGMGVAWIPLQSLGKSGNLHSALGRVVLQTWQAHARNRKIHSRRKHDGRAAGRKYENAPGTVSSFRSGRSFALRPRIRKPGICLA